MNVEIGTEAAQFPVKEYINGIFVAENVVIGHPTEDFDDISGFLRTTEIKGKQLALYNGGVASCRYITVGLPAVAM